MLIYHSNCSDPNFKRQRVQKNEKDYKRGDKLKPSTICAGVLKQSGKKSKAVKKISTKNAKFLKGLGLKVNDKR